MAKRNRSKTQNAFILLPFILVGITILLFIFTPRLINTYDKWERESDIKKSKEAWKEYNKNYQDKPSNMAKIVNEFYSKYVGCMNSKPVNEWDCDDLITTKYFTQNAINSMTQLRTKAYCGYEPPSGIYVTEESHYRDSKREDVILWGEYISPKPTIITLTLNTHGNWQIDKITCVN